MTRIGFKAMSVSAAIIWIAAMGPSDANSERYYFRLRPSISILNQEGFSLRINGDRTGVVGNEFTAQAEASSSRETLRFAVTDGALPQGVALDPATGNIRGFPTTRGNFHATVTAQDAFSKASAPLTITIYDVLEVQGTVATYATVGEPYTASFTAYGGDQHYTWTFNHSGQSPGGLTPSGMSSSIATLSGTPTTPGQFSNMTFSVADEAEHTATSLPFSITVYDILNVSGAMPDIGTVGTGYAGHFGASGGDGSYSWSATGLPAGLYMSGGTITGIPSYAGIWDSVRIIATDSRGRTAQSGPYSITIYNPLSISGNIAGSGQVGQYFESQLYPSGGRAPYNWSFVPGSSVPLGININQNGVVYGTPGASGSYTLDIRLSDADGRTSDTSFYTYISPKQTREPASGDYFDVSGFTPINAWAVSSSNTVVTWGGQVVATVSGNPGVITVNGVLYYPGTFRTGTFIYYYGVYRVVPW